MRALRVIGLDKAGEFVICQDSSGGEFYSVPVDDRLRAAVGGDTAGLEHDSARASIPPPREIQSRIRAGESVDQVAASAGLPAQRIERFAYPVLLERARTAELAQRAHPLREDGPDVSTLGEIVAHAFNVRGHDHATTAWDSWRNEDGKWIVQLHWLAGRSDNQAHWLFQPGVHGGTVTALDEHAVSLLDPSSTRSLRQVHPQVDPNQQLLDLEHQSAQDSSSPADQEQLAASGRPKVDDSGALRAKKSHPIVPSWEDVLLGVRSRN